MKREEAVRIANILVENFKMPYARQGIFEARVSKNDSGKDILYLGAGGLGLYVDIETLEVVGKERRSMSTIEELSQTPPGPRPLRPWELLQHLKGDAELFPSGGKYEYDPEDYED
jgi:hypothetical protein|tara:strand:- start:170 stop:514 length:345 start_codon:yes stop_codon:yes gene_type:complete